MRAIFGLVGLLLVLVTVGFLAKTQLKAVGGVQVPALSASDAPVAPDASVHLQSQQIQQQFKTMAESAVQAPRAMPDEK